MLIYYDRKFKVLIKHTFFTNISNVSEVQRSLNKVKSYSIYKTTKLLFLKFFFLILNYIFIKYICF